MEVTLDGAPLQVPPGGHFLQVGPRVWRDSNQMSVNIKPALWMNPLNDDRVEFAGHYAVMFGPVVLVALVANIGYHVRLCGDPTSPYNWLHRVNENTSSSSSQHASVRFTALARVTTRSSKDTNVTRVELIPIAHVVDEAYVMYPSVSLC